MTRNMRPDPKETERVKKAEQLRRKGQRALNDGDYEKAILAFRHALKQGGDPEVLLTELGAAYEAGGMAPEAYKQYARARQSVASGELEAAMASTLKQQGRGHDAVRHLQEARRLEPNDPNLALQLAETLRSMGSRRAAFAAIMEAVVLAPDDAFFHQWAGELAYEMERFPEAVSSLQAASELSPGDPEIFGMGALAMWANAQPTEALRAAQIASDLDPQSTFFRAIVAVLAHHSPGATPAEMPNLDEYDLDRLKRWLRPIGLALPPAPESPEATESPELPEPPHESDPS